MTVREAIRSLASTRVIDVQQGKSSVVYPVDRWSPLDPRLLQARGQATGQPLLLPRRLIEARRTVEVGVTELAATRRTDEHLAMMANFLIGMKQAHADSDLERFVEADLAFHVRGPGNPGACNRLACKGSRRRSRWTPGAREGGHARSPDANRAGRRPVPDPQ